MSDEWDKLQFLIDADISFCVSIMTFTDLLKRSGSGYDMGFDPCTSREVLKTGIYGWFKNGTVTVCVAKDVTPGMVKVFREGKPISSGCEGWSPVVPIDHVDEIDRVLQLKAFW
jgi:hypothetical protein